MYASRLRYCRAITSRSPEDWDTPYESTSLSFELFPNLPLEVRQMIYSCALPEPRIIQFSAELRVTNSTSPEQPQLAAYTGEVDDLESNPPSTLITTSKVDNAKESAITSKVDITSSKPSDCATELPSALLAVNKEARDWAKKTYRLSFQKGLAGNIGGIYVDFNRDTLSFYNAYSLALFCDIPSTVAPLELSTLEYLDLWQQFTILPQKVAVKETLGDLNYRHLARFENLQLLSVLKSLPKSWRRERSVRHKWNKMILAKERKRSSVNNVPQNENGSEVGKGSEGTKKSGSTLQTKAKKGGKGGAKASSIVVDKLPKISDYTLRPYLDRFWPLY